MKRIVPFIFIFLLFPSAMKAQENSTSTLDDQIADIFEQYIAESDDDIDYDTFYEDLIECAANPVNLNTATREQLKHLPFLSDRQVENIQAYVYEKGPMKTLYELQLIDGLDMTDIRRMLPFVRLGDTSQPDRKIDWKNVLKYGRNELYLRVDKGLELKEGYRTNEYSGNSWYHSLKYRFHYKDRVQAGFTAEKDAGEAFWNNRHKGYDFYSAYAQINRIGKFKTVVLGDFRASFGQGLVLHSSFGMRKSSYVLNVASADAGLKKSGSTDENHFFRGTGVTLQLGHLDVTAFYSGKKVDADTSEGHFSSIITTGYHRTINELSAKNTVMQQAAGGNFTYSGGSSRFGFTWIHTWLDHVLIPREAVYNRLYFSGDHQTVAGVFYNYRWRQLFFFGETATNFMNNGLATLNGCSFTPLSKVSLVLLQRYYSPQYDTFYATSFSENSKVNNENGVYLGAEIRPFPGWKFSAYADSYHFPWPKYGVDAPSGGMDYLMQADYNPKPDISMLWRLRYKQSEKNRSGSEAIMPELTPQERASLRYQFNYTAGGFIFRNLVEGNLINTAENSFTYGITALQDVSYSFQKMPFKIDFRYQFFDIPAYDNRIYTYEKDVLYTFSIPMFYGSGGRCYLNFRYDFNKHLSLWLKLSQTVYADDRETISSGNETISGNRKTDVRLLFKYQFWK